MLGEQFPRPLGEALLLVVVLLDVKLECQVPSGEVCFTGVAGSGEVCISRLKIGSPSSSKRLAVFTSHAAYLRVGLTLLAKFASVSKSAFSGVPRIC